VLGILFYGSFQYGENINSLGDFMESKAIDGWRGTFQWQFSFYFERRLIPYSWATSYISRGANYIGE
jgi:hypothetical protein